MNPFVKDTITRLEINNNMVKVYAVYTHNMMHAKAGDEYIFMTLPFTTSAVGHIHFTCTEECLADIVDLINDKLQNKQ